ncbi:HAD-IA family hydrolase [Kitasatospora aureofaciens]|uniref:HAD-IA family hydrolase n=1 Tax=Kitasatospora aureofaciens TaxID=1894 RepID=UPI00131CD696|nr:HAD-IA family hydrolase [Kitasatospora aureofaciens]
MAVASGGVRVVIETTMRHLPYRGLFTAVVTRDEVRQGKPAPDIFLKAADTLAVPPDRCLVYEDSDEGIEARPRLDLRPEHGDLHPQQRAGRRIQLPAHHTEGQRLTGRPHEFTNTATVTGGGDTTTHTATDRVIRGTPPSLTISKTHIGNFAQGGKGTYTITVANTGGPTDGSAFTVQDMLPPGLTAADISGPGWTCGLSAAACTRSDVLPAGTSYPSITLKVKVSCHAPHGVTNTATTTGGGDTTTHTATDPTTIKRDRDRDGERCHDDHRLTS